jgi:hypothetical protein
MFAIVWIFGIRYRMTADFHEASSEISRELSPQWLELSSRVRRLAIEAQSTGSSGSALAAEALRLCDHVERLHSDVEQLLVTLRADDDALGHAPLETLPPAPPEDIDQANIQIQDEMHQKSDLSHVIKALFMWKDDPIQRVREKHVD